MSNYSIYNSRNPSEVNVSYAKQGVLGLRETKNDPAEIALKLRN